jgi:hypothetical protein
MGLWLRYVAYARSVEQRSEWTRLHRTKRLLVSGLLSSVLLVVLAGTFLALAAVDPGRNVGAWFAACGAAAFVLPMLLQLAFWPRGALYRMLVLVLPVWAALFAVSAVVFALRG